MFETHVKVSECNLLKMEKLKSKDVNTREQSTHLNIRRIMKGWAKLCHPKNCIHHVYTFLADQNEANGGDGVQHYPNSWCKIRSFVCVCECVICMHNLVWYRHRHRTYVLDSGAHLRIRRMDSCRHYKHTHISACSEHPITIFVSHTYPARFICKLFWCWWHNSASTGSR